MMLLFLAVISYALIAVVTKSYYNIYRHKEEISPENPYMVGIIWPAYWIYRLIAWPFILGSAFLEKKIVDIRDKKEETKVRVHVSEKSEPDLEYVEAEQEVESLLAQNQERNCL